MAAPRERTFLGDAACVGVIEFEVKAPVPADRVEALRARLGPAEATEEHADAYYAHPTRDFAATDEALRLSRRAGRADLTYKGPRLDARTKARREIVLSVADEPTAKALLEALGFRPVAVVRKRRALHHAAGFEVALDDVPPLGWFVELERQLPEGADRGQAEREAMALLSSWGLDRTERRSYLELLLERGL
jgi:adenylate cyclase class 2